MSGTRVLVTSAGAAPACAVVKALRAAPGLDAVIGAVDMAERAVGYCLADWTARVPAAADPDYVERLLEIATRERVQYVFPIIDEELPVWAAHVETFARHGVHVFSNPPACVALTNDKRRTAAHCRTHDLAHPATYDPDAARALPASAYPLFAKPAGGRGSVGAARVDDPDALARLLARRDDLIVQTCLDGPEYTVDVLVDPTGHVVALVPKERLEVKSGMATKSVTRAVPAVAAFVERVIAAFGIRGAANVQVMVAGGRPTLIEVNPKFATSLPLTVAAGVNLPALLIAMARGELPAGTRLPYQENRLLLRCWDDYVVEAP